MLNSQQVLHIHPSDNVLVALQNISAGTIVSHQQHAYTLIEDIPAKHKFFLQDMQSGEPVIMYGVLVGKTLQPVKAGSRMRTENTGHAAEPYDWKPYAYQWTPPDVSKFAGRSFLGYHRSDGRVGTANYLIFIPTVFCENRNLDVIREALQEQLGYAVSNKYKQTARKLVDSFFVHMLIERNNFQFPTMYHYYLN